MMRAFFVAAMLLLVPVAHAQQAPPAIVSAAVKQRADTLARILNSEALIIGDAKSDAQVIALVEQLFAGNAELAALQKEYPGIGQEMMVAILPILNKSSRDRLPVLWERQSALYAANFTAPELDTLIAFYSSPTGQKMVQLMQAQLKPTNSIAEMAKHPDFKASPSAVLSDVSATVPKILESLDDSDKAALRKLMQSGLLDKLKALSLSTQKIALDWYDETAPGEEEAIEAALMQVLAKYEEKK